VHQQNYPPHQHVADFQTDQIEFHQEGQHGLVEVWEEKAFQVEVVVLVEGVAVV
jgi:hypothetical protein